LNHISESHNNGIKGDGKKLPRLMPSVKSQFQLREDL
jgi:hypothetical protein